MFTKNITATKVDKLHTPLYGFVPLIKDPDDNNITILCMYMTNTGAAIAYLVDFDTEVIKSRWLLIEVSQEELKLFFQGNVSFNELVLHRNDCHYFELSKTGDIEFFNSTVSKIPAEYLPNVEILFDTSYFSEEAKIFKNEFFNNDLPKKQR